MKNVKGMKNSKRNSQKRKDRKLDLTQIIMLVLIGVCVVVVIVYLIFSLVNRPENRIPQLFEQMSEDYYENVLYDYFSKSENFKNDPNKAMELYEKYGFTAVDLKTLLLYDNQKNAKYADEMKKYCKEENTFVKFYPKAPYGQKDYEANYTYSCEF